MSEPFSVDRAFMKEFQDARRVQLICEYIGAVSALNDDVPAADYGRARGLALRCITELTPAMIARVQQCVMAPNAQASFQLILELRGEIQPDSPVGPEALIWHGPSPNAQLKKLSRTQRWGQKIKQIWQVARA